MKKSIIIIFLVLIVLAIAVFGFNITGKATDTPGKYDSFAQCLSEKGVKMYGAYWCGHCNNQKEMFGSSWKYMTYVECSLPGGSGQTQECIDANIKGYPTWVFPDGTRQSGELTLKELSERTNCPL